VTRSQAIKKLEGLREAKWSSVNTIQGRKDLRKAERVAWTSVYKLEIEALNMAIQSLKDEQ